MFFQAGDRTTTAKMNFHSNERDLSMTPTYNAKPEGSQ